MPHSNISSNITFYLESRKKAKLFYQEDKIKVDLRMCFRHHHDSCDIFTCVS